jgi:integrase
MSDRVLSHPSYRRHKQSGQAVVTLSDGLGGRRDVLLGKFGTKSSREQYDRVIAEWLNRGRRLATPADGEPAGPCINELILAYQEHADEYYRGPDREPTGEANNAKMAMRPLKKLYGSTPIATFGIDALEVVRNQMVADGMARSTINKRVNLIRRMFRWGVEKRLVSPAVCGAMLMLKGLKRFRSNAHEPDPIKPVAIQFVEATLPYLNPTIAAMVRLQLLSGARPGEICRMRAAELDVTGPVWEYKPARHKNAYRGLPRTIFIGPQAQAILKPFLKLDLNAPIFSPADAMKERYADLRAKRKTPVQPSQQSRKKRRPQIRPGEAYTTQSYARSIARAVERCNQDLRQRANKERRELRPDELVPHWHPNQLRHAAGTRVRKEMGLETSGAVLGHTRMSATEVYAVRDQDIARQAAAKLG